MRSSACKCVFRVQMRLEISRLHNRLEATMIYVTHDQVEAMTMGDGVVVLNQGEIQQIAAPPTLYHQPANEFVAGFIGTPPMNFIDAQIVSRNGVPKLSFENFELDVNSQMKETLNTLSGTEVRLGISPEDILVDDGLVPEDAANRVSTMVDLVEPLGSNVLLYLRTVLNSFIARAEGTVFPEQNSELTVTFNMEKAHLFDPNAGQSLTA